MKLLFKAFKTVVIDDILEKMPDFKTLSPQARRVGQVGLFLVAGLIVLTLFFYFSRHFVKNWIDLPVGTGVTGITLSFAGPVGLPPVAIWIACIVTCLAFGFVMAGARQCHGVIYGGVSIVFAGYLGLLSYLANHTIVWVAYGLSLVVLGVLFKKERKKTPHLGSEIVIYSVLGGLFFVLLKIFGGVVSVALVTGQVLMLFVLTAYWLLLGMDTIDSGTSAGRWLAGVITQGLSIRVASLVIPLLLVVKITLTLLFAPMLWADAIVTSLFLLGILYSLIRKKGDVSVLIYLTAFSVVGSILTYYILLAFHGTNVAQSVFFFVPAAITFTFFMVWDLIGLGRNFVDGDSSFLPRAGRLCLLLGWVMLATNTMFFFFACKDDAFERFANQASAEAVLVSGIPLLLYLIFYRGKNIALGEKAEDSVVKKNSFRRTGIFFLLGFFIALALGFANKLTLVKFARAAILTNKAGLIINSDPEKAEAFYKLALDADPDYYKGHFNLGTFYFSKNRFKEALPEFQKAIFAKKDYVQAYVNLGITYDRLGQKELAIHFYKEALLLDPKLAFAYNNLGVLEMEQGQWAQALNNLKKAVEFATTENASFYNNLAQAEMETGDFEGAVGHLQRALELRPEDSSVYLTLGLLYNQWGTQELLKGNQAQADLYYDAAQKNYETALKLGVDDFLIGTNLSQLYMDRGEMKKALDLAQKTAQKYPNDANIHHILGIIFYQMKDVASARKEFKKAKELDSGYYYAFEGEALLDLEAGDYAASAKGYEEALKLGHDTPANHFNLGLAYKNLKEFTKALAEFENVIKMNAGYKEEAIQQKADIHLTLAENLFEQKNDNAALSELDKTLALTPQNAWALFQYGRILYLQGKYKEAIDYLNKAISAHPDFINAYAFLGMCHQALGNKNDALEVYQKALAICNQKDVCDLIQQALESVNQNP